jgi:hypothetical protein
MTDRPSKLKQASLRVIRQADIRKCPHMILVSEHYREDGSCKCNDPNETVMASWGYRWDGKVWAS